MNILQHLQHIIKQLDYIINLLAKTTTSSTSFGTWVSDYFNLYKTNQDGSVINKDNVRYIKSINNHPIAKILLHDLKGTDIQAFLKNYDNHSNTRQKLYNLINSCLKSAVANQLIKFNPCIAVNIIHHKSAHYPVIQPCDHQRIMDNIVIPKYNAFFIFMMCTGLRMSEAFASIPFIDYERCVVIVVNHDTTTKKHKREVPFLFRLFQVDFQNLLPSLTQGGCSTYFKRLFKKLNLNIVLHSMRHTFASCCYLLGFKDKQIQAWLGHSTINMTLDTYTHIINGDSPFIDYLKKLKSKLNL